MIDFKPLELSDKQIIESYTLTSNIPNCDFAFGNLYAWKLSYDTHWAIVEGFLVIKFTPINKDERGFLQPLGKDGDFSSIIPLLQEDVNRTGHRLQFFGLNEQGSRCLHSFDAEGFACYAHTDRMDYIYEASALKTLAGRKYQQKRNHINHFKNEFDFHFIKLDKTMMDECLRLEALWRSARNDAETEIKEELDAEQIAMLRSFGSFDELQIIGGAICVDGNMVAFTYGTKLTEDTFCTHVEKADTSYEGAFAVINQYFAQSLPEQFKYINREEDLGIPGLRKAKRSYNPYKLQPKATARKLTDEEVSRKLLWRQAFSDDYEYIDRFFLTYGLHAISMTEKDSDGKVISMLHIISFDCELGHMGYLYAVATDLQWQGSGLSTKLLEKAKKLHEDGTFDLLALIPSSLQNKEFYAKRGFETEIPVVFQLTDDFQFGMDNDELNRAMVFGHKATNQGIPPSLTLEPHYSTLATINAPKT